MVEVDEDVLRPQLLAQFFARDYFAGILEQQFENAQWLVLEPDLEAVLAQLAGARIELVHAEPDDVPRGSTCWSDSRRAVVAPHSNGLPWIEGGIVTVMR